MKPVARELTDDIMNSEGVQEVRWDKDGIKAADDYKLLWKGNGNYRLEINFYIRKRIRSAVKRKWNGFRERPEIS